MLKLRVTLLCIIILSMICNLVLTEGTGDGYYGKLKYFKHDYLTKLINHTRSDHTNFIDHTVISNVINKAMDLLQSIPQNISYRDISPGCIQKVMQLSSNKLAAATYIDALGKPGAGIMNLNMLWLGDYEGCSSLSDAHYCNMRNILLKLSNFTLPLTYGICAPKECSVEDITQGLRLGILEIEQYLKKANIEIIVLNAKNGHTLPSVCIVEDPPYTSGAIAMIVISSIILILCFVGTVVELTHKMLLKRNKFDDQPRFDTSLHAYQDVDGNNIQTDYEISGESTKKQVEKEVSLRTIDVNEEGSFLVRFLTCFSWAKNTKALMNTDVPKGAISSINGIRTISITWVVLGHVLYFMILMGLSDNPGTIMKTWLSRFSMEGLLNATVSVDTFFLLSGLLVSYLSLKRMENFGSLPLLRYYLHRYIRLTPSYAFLIFFVTFLLPFLGYGPLWPSTLDPNCSDKWWTNLLYINNIVPSNILKQCYGVAWYLAIDMQYYIISPIILWCMYKFKLFGVVVTSGVMFLQNFITNGVLVAVYDASATFTLDGQKDPIPNIMVPTETSSSRYQNNVYFKTYTRFGPYMVGLVLGYILFYKKTVRATVRPLFFAIGWIVAIGTALGIVYGPHANNRHASEAVNVFYCMVFRTFWAIAVGWVIYACHNGYGGLINNFLSWRVFIPLSRLTYGVYLIHIYVILFFGYTQQTPFHVTEITLSFLFIGITFVSYVISFMVSVCIEYPVFNLEQLVISSFQKRQRANPHTRF